MCKPEFTVDHSHSANYAGSREALLAATARGYRFAWFEITSVPPSERMKGSAITGCHPERSEGLMHSSPPGPKSSMTVTPAAERRNRKAQHGSAGKRRLNRNTRQSREGRASAQ